ncbi:hypothetical protein EsDP_00005733 [Epichloe bromicola]|uniref:Uncharacterized protein n=1 Tax=Epichloe bromicola TaxID=79588 RepID=A0ABQ0CVK0_9HYPO
MSFQLPSILQQSGFNASTGNGTGPTDARGSAASFPAGVMDSFLATAGQASPLMQVFFFVYRMLGSYLGLDPSVLLTLLGFFWAFSKIGSQIYAHISDLIDRHFMCAIFVSEYDHIYSHVMKWLSQQPRIRNSQYLSAQTVWKSAWEEEEDLESALFFTDGGDGDSDRKYLNFSNQAARSSPRYVPAMEPIKKLLADAKDTYYHDTHQKTAIYRPKPKELRHDHSMWQQVARRPVRPMRTVVLDHEEKHAVLADMNEYLHPATPKWYASRGIPLRRGYLLHGPPGTGKTSFSFSCAGVFGVDIYVISLQDINVTEEDLAVLFTRLPRRCIVLLEDIDTAGLRRDGDDDDNGDTEPGEKQSEKEGNEAQRIGVSEPVKEEDETKSNGDKTASKKKRGKKTEKAASSDESAGDDDDDDDDSSESSEEDLPTKRKRKNLRSKKNTLRRRKGGSKKKVLAVENISLSGLLNAIDGVASHEGRILIMTTNKPESLDDALIRPGRIDVQVAFKNASSHQAGELFYRMYEEVSPPKPVSGDGSDSAKAVGEDKRDRPSKMTTPYGELLDVTMDEVKSISEEFGKRIPEGVFSPAEIQGFLLKRKKDPRKALEDLESWVEGLKKQKESHSKVVTVQ